MSDADAETGAVITQLARITASARAVQGLREGAATRAATAASGELPPNVVTGITSSRNFL